MGTVYFQLSGKVCKCTIVELGEMKTKVKNYLIIPTGTFGARSSVGWLIIGRKFQVHGVCSQGILWGARSNCLAQGPFSYKTYLTKMLKRQLWGNEIVLWSVSMMWNLKITVVNSKTLQECRFHHDVALWHVDVGLVYNTSTHYTAAGESSVLVSCYSFFLLVRVACLVLESYLCTCFNLSNDLVTCTTSHIKIKSLSKIFCGRL